MRIVIDLQGAQSSGSRNRGIGRYSQSLAKAIIRNKGEHEVIIALNGLFPDSIESIRADFQDLLPQKDIRVWHAPGPTSHLDSDNNWRRKTAELIREAFLVSLRPDIVYITSLFEGLGDDAVTSVGKFSHIAPTAVTLYDLIPLINRTPYLDNPAVESWYENKLDQLRRADLLLGISESSRQEGIKYVGFPSQKSVNVSTAADPQFQRIKVDHVVERRARERYGLYNQFVMYTGGIDHRKNIEGLIRGYALLPKVLRENHQLAIVCSVQPENRRLLDQLAKEQGLAENEMILTGFVPEEDLITLYNLCKAFIFPSWHEGFGLPALEAMACGAAVIGANTSSLPEVIGRADALFDPRDESAIAEKLTQVLTDTVFREELICHGLAQAKTFSWDKSAKSAITAFERLYSANSKPQSISPTTHRPTLAYISPLPPERSGIADYSAELLPELSRYYQIDVIVAQGIIADPWINENCSVRSVEWFVRHSHRFERILYHFGNSHYHKHMFALLERAPGTVILHDFFLSGIAAYMADQKWVGGFVGAWEACLYHSHGYSALIDFTANRDVQIAINRFPCNRAVLENAHGVIVHSDYPRQLARKWLGDTSANDWAVIPLLRAPAINEERAKARTSLSLDDDAFVVCSIGLLGPTKQSRRLLEAWLASQLSKDKRCFLVFAGENHGGDYGADLSAAIRSSEVAERIRITGWTDTTQFRHYLAAADVGVQLRTLSRGETSAAVLDCMNYGLATIVNANGSMADLPNDAVWMLEDEFSNEALKDAIEALWKDKQKRLAIGERAREVVQIKHNPRACADQYAESIERYYTRTQGGKENLIKSIAKVDGAPDDEEAWRKLARDIDSNHNQSAILQLMVDISDLMRPDANDVKQLDDLCVLAELLANPPKGFRTEPVYVVPNGGGYRYARQFTLSFLKCPPQTIADETVTAFGGEIFLGLSLNPDVEPQRTAFCQYLRRIGAQVHFVVHDLPPIAADDAAHKHVWLPISGHADGFICNSCATADGWFEWLNAFGPKRLRPLKLGWFREETASVQMRSTENVDTDEVPQSKTSRVSLTKSTQKLLTVILNGPWYHHWMPDSVHRYWGNDNRLGTQVGKRAGRNIVCTSQAGYLIFGPYIQLDAGAYQITIRGTLEGTGLAGARMDATGDKGNHIYADAPLDQPDDSGCFITLPIKLDTPCSDLEVRIWVSAESDLQVSLIEIAPVNDDTDLVHEIPSELAELEGSVDTVLTIPDFQRMDEAEPDPDVKIDRFQSEKFIKVHDATDIPPVNDLTYLADDKPLEVPVKVECPVGAVLTDPAFLWTGEVEPDPVVLDRFQDEIPAEICTAIETTHLNDHTDLVNDEPPAAAIELDGPVGTVVTDVEFQQINEVEPDPVMVMARLRSSGGVDVHVAIEKTITRPEMVIAEIEQDALRTSEITLTVRSISDQTRKYANRSQPEETSLILDKFVICESQNSTLAASIERKISNAARNKAKAARKKNR